MRIGNTLSYLNVHSPQKPKEVLDEIQNNSIKETTKEHTTNNYYNRSAENLESYQTVYNNATLENSNKVSQDNTEEQLSDDEITLQLDKKLYDECHLKYRGIEFNSKEFKEWKEEMKPHFIVPVNTPPKVRKALTETIDSVKDESVKSEVQFSLWEQMKSYDKADSTSYPKAISEIISDNKDYITALKNCNLSQTAMVKKAIKETEQLIDVFSQIKNKLKNIDIFNQNSTRVNFSDDLVSHPIIYNNAPIENSNSKLANKQEDSMTDEEITYEMNKDIYDSENLSEKGIKFNSKEFFEWLETHKSGRPVPYDAPPKIRKNLKDTLDKLRNENGIVWFRVGKALARGLKNCDTKDPKSYLNICDNTIQKSRDMLSSIAMAGLNDSPMFKSTIMANNALINVFSKIRSDINSYFSE
ncbi:hypothetical protein NNC19_18080 [Clostridium sp. SHJSY1]|uniref:hypothetical protein n=1 Tax=Clostridium sp. SHJSY1 TaxID=2942483 RepID=UPI002873FF02|nr:hypothetical protein [Clostridium sp. SHJSY1]MDS0527602.1 hypothetical protein [Clostridium sp. SHJSY1]